jgi:ATP-dependent helicase/nuclease subunit A
MMMQDLLQEDEKSRVRALELSSFIVEAPAGAGKTELLTQRFLKLLQTVASPEEIIAITFTNKAASEMKSRIMDSLQMAASGVEPPQAHKQATFALGLQALQRSAALNWRLLETPSRLRIYTIDSLSGNLARQMPLLSRFGTQPAVRDDASIYYQEAATRALAHLDDANLGEVVQAALRYFDNDTFKLTNLLAEMLAKRDQWLPYSQNANTAQAAQAALTHVLTQELQAVAEVLTPSLQAALMPIARYAASQLPCDAPIALLLDWETPILATPPSLVMWRAVSELLLTSAGTLRKRLDKNMGLPATDEAKPYKEALLEIIATLQQTRGAEAALARIKLLPNATQEASTWQIIATLGQLLHIAVAELWLVFQTHGEVDFVEISQRALLALGDEEGNTTDLALKLDYRIQHLLVDEFQDTSPTQIKLIRALTRGWQAGDGRTLFCVGDPMQSIYRFRKANVGLFLRVAQSGIGDLHLTPLKLWRNNRSCPPVVDWVNLAFAQVFPSRDSSAHGAIQYRPFVATRADAANTGVFVHAMLDETQSSDAGDSDEAVVEVRQLEADKIIQIIQATRQHNPDHKIAVLVRARSHLHALVTAIRRNHPDLSFQAVEIEELANRQVVQDLLSLSYALHQRADRVHWLAVLRAPWCGLTLADLHALVAGDKSRTLMQLMHDEARLQTLSEDGRARLLHVRQVMQQALQHQARMSTSRWLHSVWLMLGGAECLWEANDVRDVQAFFERVQQLENTGQFSPEQLAVEVQKLYAAPDAKADDSLQFMTIHKSKGLEFHTVILPGLDRKTGGNEQPLLLWEEVAIDSAAELAEAVDLIVAPLTPKGYQRKTEQVTPYDYLKMLEKQRAEYEDARVLYVAATRAECCLHLLGAAKYDASKNEVKVAKNTFLEMLWPIVHSQFTPEFALENSISAPTKPSMELAQFVPQLVRLAQPSVPSAIAVDITESAASTSINYTQEPAVAEHASLEADIGTLTHLYLQNIAEQGVSLWLDKDLNLLQAAMQRWFVQQGHTPNQAEMAVKQVQSLLSKTLRSAQGQWVLQAHSDAMSELALQSLAGAPTKIIDRTFIADGQRWIIDYKTTALEPSISEAKLQSLSEQYRPQLTGYAELFAHEGLTIQKAVFFVSVARLVLI